MLNSFYIKFKIITIIAGGETIMHMFKIIYMHVSQQYSLLRGGHA